MLTKPLVLLLDGRYSDYDLERDSVEQNGGLFELSGSLPGTEEEVLAVEPLGRATILLVELAPVTRAVLTAASSCRAVVRYGTGHDNIDDVAAEELEIRVFSVPDYAAESVSEHAMALIFASATRLFRQIQLVREGQWRSGDQDYRQVGLVGTTIGIVGVGAIGRALATRARAFGMRVVGYDPYVSPEQLAEVVEPVSLDQLLEQSDYVSLHLPLTESTREIIDAKAIVRMKRGAVIINTSRGGLINEADLAHRFGRQSALLRLFGRCGHRAVAFRTPPPLPQPGARDAPCCLFVRSGQAHPAHRRGDNRNTTTFRP